jgi:hypothetical protein
MPSFFFFFFRIFSGSGDRGTCHCRGIVSGTLYTYKDFLWNFTLVHIVSGIWDFFFQAVCWFSSFCFLRVFVFDDEAGLWILKTRKNWFFSEIFFFFQWFFCFKNK